MRSMFFWLTGNSDRGSYGVAQDTNAAHSFELLYEVRIGAHKGAHGTIGCHDTDGGDHTIRKAIPYNSCLPLQCCQEFGT